MNKIKNFLKALDQFGVPYQQKIIDERIYKSVFGGFISLFIYSISLSYSLYILFQWANNDFLPNIQSKSAPISDNTTFIFPQNPIKLEIGLEWKDKQHRDRMNIFTSYTERIYVTRIFQQDNLKPNINASYIANGQDDCLPDHDHTDSICMDLKKQPYSISQYENGDSQNIVMAISLCENHTICAETWKINQFLNQTQQTLFLSATVQQYDPLSGQIVNIVRRFNLIMNTNQMLSLSIVFQLQEIYIKDGGLFPGIEKKTIISDFKLVPQTIPGGQDGSTYYSGKIILTFISLDKIKIVTQVEFVQVGQILAQIGSIISILLFFQYIVIFINQSRLYATVTLEVLKIYNPEMRQKKINIDILGRLQSIEGMNNQQAKEFFDSNKEFANQQLSIISQLQSIVQLQWAILNFYPTPYLKLLSHQSLGRSKYFKQNTFQKIYPDRSQEGTLIIQSSTKDSDMNQRNEDVLDFFFNQHKKIKFDPDFDREAIPLELKLDRIKINLISNELILNQDSK